MRRTVLTVPAAMAAMLGGDGLAMSFDEADRVLMLYGNHETWIFDGTTWVRAGATAGS